MPDSLSSSGTNTLLRIILPFETILSPILFSIFVALRPGALFFTINLEMCIRLSTSGHGNSYINWVTYETIKTTLITLVPQKEKRIIH
jgi:hypothetical protein